MNSRTRDKRLARELALDILYQAEIRDQLPTEVLSFHRHQGWSLLSNDDSPVEAPSEQAVGYVSRLIEGVQEHLSEIDARIAHSSDRWALDRMPVVDKNLLRLALYELLWVPDVPDAVVINEAVEIAKSLSTEESGKFINGILGRVADEIGPARNA